MASGVRVDGLRQAIRKLEQLGVAASDLKEAMYRIAQKPLSEAKSRAPHRTGALAASIRASKAKSKAVLRAGSAKVAYASFQEFGTSKNPERRFMRGAVQDNEGYVTSQLDLELKKLIARYDLN